MKNLSKELHLNKKFRGIFQEVSDAEVQISGNKNDTEKVAKKDIDEIKREYSDFGIGDFDFNETETEQLDILFGGLFGKLSDILDDMDIDGLKIDESLTKKEQKKKDKEKKKEEKYAKKNGKNNDKLNEMIENGDKLSAEDALKILNPNIQIKSTSYGLSKDPIHLKDRSSKSTSLEGIVPKTIEGVNFIQKNLNTPIVITGGTEDGHSGGINGGQFTHGGGGKIDISFKDGVEEKMDEYISSKNPQIKTLGIGNKYIFNDGDFKYEIIKESDHYDIKVV